MPADYRDIITRLRARIARMLPRDLAIYSYETDPDYILLRNVAESPYAAQTKYLAFSAAARATYLTARGSFVDSEDMYLAASEPFRELAKIARRWCP